MLPPITKREQVGSRIVRTLLRVRVMGNFDGGEHLANRDIESHYHIITPCGVMSQRLGGGSNYVCPAHAISAQTDEL